MTAQGVSQEASGDGETQAAGASVAHQGGAAAAVPTNVGSTSFPVAGIREAPAVTPGLFLRSKMWWVTIACFVVAFWLTWQSIPSKGPTIVIRFPDGHGLKAGDAVRHRGIDAGIVESVALSEDLSQITATVTLTPGAAGLAKEGARFWIVRPQLSLAGVSGLDTAVGAKYIGVSPGNPEGPGQSHFDGLNVAPPDENSGEGIDIVLRSDAKHGVFVGAPITWRGVDVGQILSINLSPDARFVDVHAQINAEYARLLRTTSKFWVTSGLGIDVGLSGVRLNADSLSTIVRGGVSFATLAVGKDKTPVSSGHMFVLHDTPDPEWLSSASSLPLIDFELPPTVTIQGTRKTSLFGISRNQKFTVNGLLVSESDRPLRLLTAADILPPPVESGASVTVEPVAPTEFLITSPLSDGSFTLAVRNASDDSLANLGLLWMTCGDAATGMPAAPLSRLRVPQEPEECCLCRSVKADNDASTVIQSISRDQLTKVDNVWSVTMDVGDLSPWHGAPVISILDGKVIGVFMAAKSGATIVPYHTETSNH